MNEESKQHHQKCRVIRIDQRLECFPFEIEMIEDPVEHLTWSSFGFQSEPDARKGDEIEG
jgi:hypothetical protein